MRALVLEAGASITIRNDVIKKNEKGAGKKNEAFLSFMFFFFCFLFFFFFFHDNRSWSGVGIVIFVVCVCAYMLGK